MQTAFYDDLKQRFLALLTEHGLLQEKVSLHTKMLTPEEAIGIPKRKDFPILSGKDIMVQAECWFSRNRRGNLRSGSEH